MADQSSPQEQIALLRAQRNATSDAGLRSALDAAIAALEAQVQQHTQTLEGNAQAGAAIAGNVAGNVVAPLFPGSGTGNYIAGVINVYGTTQAQQTSYGAALRRYLEYLYTSHATLDLRGIDDRPMDMPLSELFVSLDLHEPPIDELRGRGALRKFMDTVRRVVTREEQEDVIEARDQRQAVSWPQALRQPRLAVIGTPGSGKTTLLHYTTVRLAEVLARDDDERLADLGLSGAPPVPLLLPLRELGAYLQEGSLRETNAPRPRLLLDCIANYYAGFDLDLPADFFSRLCDAGRAILLLDGLDEVARKQDRVFVSAIVREFVQRYRSCRCVVTSRIAAYQDDARIEADFRVCTVADLSEEQQRRFIANWSRSLYRLIRSQATPTQQQQEAERYTAELLEALQQNERVRSLAVNPLLLTVICVIYYNSYVLPEDRAALYEECIEVLLRGGRGKADRAGQQRVDYSGSPNLSMGLNPKRELLSAVAYTMHQRGEAGQMVSREDLTNMVAEHLRHRSDAREAAHIFVDELPVHIGLLDEREPDRFAFSHLSFQEYLAARHVAETDRWGELLDHYQESRWREVILLCAGHLSQERCWRFLEQLIERGQTPIEHAAALELAATALVELERFKGQGPLSERIQREAVAILEAPVAEAPAQARVTCGIALAHVGDPRPGVCTLPPVMVNIQGGTFVIGMTRTEINALPEEEREIYQDAVNEQPITVSSFLIGKYPVTNAQFQHFIDDDGYNSDASWWDEVEREWIKDLSHQRTFEPWEDALVGRGRPNHPVIRVTWYEAQAFCRWLTQHDNYNPDGLVYRLPTEAEWEWAARGGQRRHYPWGNDEPNYERANYLLMHTTTAVRCFPAGETPEGIADLAGNVREWTSSRDAPYPYNFDDGYKQLTNFTYQGFILRGSSWIEGSSELRVTCREGYSPDYRNYNVGFRLAADLPV